MQGEKHLEERVQREKDKENKLSGQHMDMNAEAKLFFNTVLPGVSGGIRISRDDEKFSVKYMSEAVAAIQGYSVDELMKVSGGNTINNCYVADRQHLMNQMRHDFNLGDTYALKYRVRAKDGTLKWILDSGMKVRSPEGEELYYSLIQDVTQLEKSNLKIKNTLDMLAQMVGSLNSGVLAYTIPDHTVLMMNEEAKRLFGIGQEPVEGVFQHLTRDKVVKEDYGEIQSVIRLLKESGDGVTYVFRTRMKDGQTYKIQAHTKLLQFDDGTRFILSSLLDITEQSALTEMLSQERKRYRDALTANCEFSFSFDVTEGFIRQEYVTKQGFNLLRELDLRVPVRFDFMMQEWIRVMKPRFLNENIVVLLNCEELISRFKRGDTRVEFEYRNSSGKKFTRVSALLSENSVNGHVIAVVSAVDITEERIEEQETKQALMDAYDAANRANQAKSDFLSHMSHDIRTPMNAIIGMTSIAATHLDDKDRVADCLAKVTSSSKHLLTLINEVLDMSKIESGKMELTEEEINLPELIDNLLVMVRPQLDAKGHELKLTIQNVEHEHVVGDSLHIQQAFVNIMSNAVKYTPEKGKISFTITEKVTNQPKVGCYEFVFEDNGIGMSPEYLEHIFEPFSRADESSHNKVQGTGLGLAITLNIIRMMGGDVKVESEEGKGSKFIVTMFLKLRDVTEVSCEQFLNLPVLVADDEKSACESTCIMLKELGMRGEWVLTGGEAVEKVREAKASGNDYFAVILDWHMPQMNGIAAAKEIRKIMGDGVTIIMLSAHDWTEIEMEARAAGVDAFISKPLFKSRLLYLFRSLAEEEDTQVKEEKKEQTHQEDFTGRRVLLVEDNEINAEIAQEILESTGLMVDHVWDGSQAVNTLLEIEPGYYDLVFMDVQMPVMNGYEAARAIRSTGRKDLVKIPIIAMTANAFAEDVQTAMNAGMNQHIAKPLDISQLMGALNKWLEN